MMIIKPANEISQDISMNVSFIFIEFDQKGYTSWRGFEIQNKNG